MLEKERTHFLQSNLVITELKNMVVDFELEGTATKSMTSAASYQSEITQIAQKLVRLEAKKQVSSYNSSTTGNNKLMGMSPEDIAASPSPKSVKAVSLELIRRLEANIKSLIEFAEYQPTEGNSNLAIYKEFVSHLASNRLSAQNTLKSSFDAVDALYLNYFSLLGKTLFLLIHLLNDDKFKAQVQQDQLQVKFLQTRAQTMILKLSVLQHQIAADAYTGDSVAALTEIKNQMQARMQTTQGQLSRGSKQLAQYESLGQGFTQLVRQYVSIMDATKDRQWTLDQLSGK